MTAFSAASENRVDQGPDRRSLRQDQQAAESDQNNQRWQKPPLLPAFEVRRALLHQRLHASTVDWSGRSFFS
jgi:hypothetical protein